jgi:hypothetical protein
MKPPIVDASNGPVKIVVAKSCDSKPSSAVVKNIGENSCHDGNWTAPRNPQRIGII